MRVIRIIKMIPLSAPATADNGVTGNHPMTIDIGKPGFAQPVEMLDER